MNKLQMSGRLTRDPEVRYTAGSTPTALAKFGIAVDRKVRSENAPQVDFFNCVAWGKTAEHMEKYWRKGMKAMIGGRLENNIWTDKTGQKHTDAQIVVEEIEFCEKKENNLAEPPAESREELPFEF